MAHNSTANAAAAASTSANNFNATLKGKISGLEETCKALTEEINFYSSEIQSLRGEKQELEQSLARKTNEIRQQLTADVAQ